MVKSRSPALRTSMDDVNLRAVLHKFSPTHPFLLKSLAGTIVDPISITVMRIISTLNMKGERWAHSCGWVTTLFKAIWSQYGYQVLLPPPSDMILWSTIWINLGWTVIRFQYLLLGNQFGESKVYGKKNLRISWWRQMETTLCMKPLLTSAARLFLGKWMSVSFDSQPLCPGCHMR